MFPQPQQVTPEAGGGTPFNANARDAGRLQQQPAPQQMQGQYPQQMPAMAPQLQMPYTPSGEPTSPYPQGQPSPQLMPGVAAAFGLQVPPPVQTAPQQMPQQMPQAPVQQPYNPMTWFQQGYPQPLPQQPVQQLPQQQPGQQQIPGQQVPVQQQPTPQMAEYVQQQSEAAYGTALFRAMNEPDFLEKLAQSSNPIEKQLAQKVLERNSEHFGAGNLEAFQANLELQKAGDDPTKQELARMKLNQVEQAKQMQKMQWDAWKSTNGIKDDAFGNLVDAVRLEFPNANPADVVHLARGRSGISPQQQMTIESNPGVNGAGGGGSRGGQPQDQGASAEGLALFGLSPAMQNQTEAYMRAVGAIR